MEASVRKQGETFVIHLSGKVDFDSSEPFRRTMMSHIVGSSVVFNMKNLNFVGSNGITPFVQTIKDLCENTNTQVRFCHLSSEFERIFEANQIDVGVNFLDENQAIQSLFSPASHVMPAFEEPRVAEEVVVPTPVMNPIPTPQD